MDSGLKLVKLTFSFHSRVRIQGGNIFFSTKIHGFYRNPRILVKIPILAWDFTIKNLWPNEWPFAQDGNPTFCSVCKAILTNSPSSDPAICVISPHTDVCFCGDGDRLNGCVKCQSCGQVHNTNIISVRGAPGEIWVLWKNIKWKFAPKNDNYPQLSLFCSGGEFLSAVLNSLQWNRVPSILPMRTKSKGNEVILSTFNHSTLNKNNTTTHSTLNKNNTTTHRVQIVKIQNQKSIKLSYNLLLQDTFTIVHETNNQSLVPNLYNV